ncbi:hypothetical protein SESBI_17842 [Sesbania bispinosa]|nr:hypothetical protein SESBI_17842 [Sesbania bispinosa]
MAEESSRGMTMESHASSARKRPTKNDKLCLEDYIHLLHSRQTIHLTMNQLNQVLFYTPNPTFQFSFSKFS